MSLRSTLTSTTAMPGLTLKVSSTAVGPAAAGICTHACMAGVRQGGSGVCAPPPPQQRHLALHLELHALPGCRQGCADPGQRTDGPACANALSRKWPKLMHARGVHGNVTAAGGHAGPAQACMGRCRVVQLPCASMQMLAVALQHAEGGCVAGSMGRQPRWTCPAQRQVVCTNGQAQILPCATHPSQSQSRSR